jgi:thiamine-phosphate pyrophosphorylase
MTPRLERPIICVVTRARGRSGSPERRALLERLAAAAGAGASLVQIRERQFNDRDLAGFVREVVAAVKPAGALVTVNDRTDVALVAGADGVHLKSDGPSPQDVRRIVPPDFVVGRSVHHEDEAVAMAATNACDYLLFGTVFPSRSKPPDHQVAGIDALARVCRSVTLPVLAIGGVTVDRAGELIRAGAAGVAAISLFSDAPDVAAVVHALRDALTVRSGNV